MLRSLSEAESALYTPSRQGSDRLMSTGQNRLGNGVMSRTQLQGKQVYSTRGITIMHKNAFRPDDAENTSARTPEEIYASHGQALVAEDLDRLAANFAEDAVQISPAGVRRGRD